MNLEEIDKYIKWKDRWSKKDNIDIYQYISFNIHPDDILIIGKLLFPETIEIDLMPYFKDNEKGGKHSQDDYYKRRVASEEDVKSLIWLTKMIIEK